MVSMPSVRSVVKIILQFCKEHHLKQSFAALSAETQARRGVAPVKGGAPFDATNR